MNLKKKTSAIAALTLTLAAILGGATAANANGGANIHDAQAVIKSISPELLPQTASLTDSPLELSTSQAEAAVLTIDPTDLDEAAVQSRSSSNAQQMETSPALSIEPQYLKEKLSSDGGIEVWSTDSDAAAAYVQPTIDGVRVFTAIADRSAPTQYSYKMDIPEGSTLRRNGIGYLISDPFGYNLGAILEPWAKDSLGRDLPTEYTFTGNGGYLRSRHFISCTYRSRLELHTYCGPRTSYPRASPQQTKELLQLLLPC
ncbi:hypothetical protein [Microbacterium sp. XT11]|uniref:hypothetical protein n=1 Tax=Microbacterium sp. XT11 TaxID=367477 RepID=UPI0012F7291D|nr:hypothetical protein [Microbacterium sp. XT11]